MDLMDFSALFLRDLGDEKKEEEEEAESKKLACSGSASKSSTDCRGQRFLSASKE